MEEQTRVPGWGIDRRAEDRPGYPLEQAHRVDHDTLQGESPWRPTIPPRGLSGLLRRAAYRVPDWKPRRWMLLMLSDRIDLLEHRLRSPALWIGGGLTSTLAAVLWRRRRRRR